MTAPARRVALRLAALAALTAAGAGPARATLLDRLRGRNGDDSDADDEALDGAGSPGAVHLPAGARAERDLAYGADPQQRLDVYIPAGATKAPIVLMVHGGAWMIGDKGNRGVAGAKVARWLPRGFIVVSTNYRMDRSAPDPLQQADDVARALGFVQQRAAGWGGDGSRVLLMGHSAGAHLVALLSADAGILERAGAKPVLGTVALDSAALDVVAVMEGRHPRFYDRVFGRERERWVANSPYHRLRGTPPPMLLVCSSRRDDSCAQAERFAAKARAAGGRAGVLPVALKHGEVNAQLGEAGGYTEQVEAFMKGLGLP